MIVNNRKLYPWTATYCYKWKGQRPSLLGLSNLSNRRLASASYANLLHMQHFKPKQNYASFIRRFIFKEVSSESRWSVYVYSTVLSIVEDGSLKGWDTQVKEPKSHIVTIRITLQQSSSATAVSRGSPRVNVLWGKVLFPQSMLLAVAFSTPAREQCASRVDRNNKARFPFDLDILRSHSEIQSTAIDNTTML